MEENLLQSRQCVHKLGKSESYRLAVSVRLVECVDHKGLEVLLNGHLQSSNPD